MNNIVYDIECYPNVFTITLRMHLNTYWRYEISNRRNDVEALLRLLMAMKRNGDRMVGFNNEGYDYPVLHFVMDNRPLPQQIYGKSMSIIESDDRFENIIWDNKQYLPQVDLFKIHHFDNLAKSTSLKMLEFNMRSESIQDLPFPPGTVLTSPEIDQLLYYNQHDVDETYKFLQKSAKEIAFRDELSAKYDKNFTNFNDTKIGKQYFLMMLEKYNPGCTRTADGPRQTHRASINIGEIILPYIEFKNPAFNALKDWFSRQVIRQTKGVFSEISQDSLGSLYEHCHTKKVRKNAEKYKGVTPVSHWFERPAKITYACWNEATSLNCIVNGFQFDFGTGGIHGSIDSQTVRTDAAGQIIDVDVAAFYPNIAIKNKLYPEHLGETFCTIYQDVLTERGKYKKGTTENLMLKLASNGTFGDTNSIFSSFYDPQYTMSITINGQLLLCLLVDWCIAIPGLRIIQANTDGITVKCPHEHVAWFRSICQAWEKYTCLTLEYVDYSTMWIRDVNNYLAQYGPSEKNAGELKKKGAYLDKPEWHKNHSSLVIQKAAVAVLAEGADLHDFIYRHSDPMDFLLRTKVPKTSKLYHGDKQIQNITRYYISNTGHPLVKVMPPTKKNPGVYRKIGINKGWLTTECNEWTGNLLNVNYEFYIQEAKKLIDVMG